MTANAYKRSLEMMLKRVLLPLLALVVLGLPEVSLVYAGALKLTKIGNLDTSSANYKEWWYTGTNPKLSGSANASASVEVSIDDTKSTTTADSTGNWSVNATNLAAGDHKVNISSSGEVLVLTLHIGVGMPSGGQNTATGSASTTPQTGLGMPTITVTVLSLLLVLSGVLLGKREYLRR